MTIRVKPARSSLRRAHRAAHRHVQVRRSNGCANEWKTTHQKHNPTRLRIRPPTRTQTPHPNRERRRSPLRPTHLPPPHPMDPTRHTMGIRPQQQPHRLDRTSPRRLQPTRRSIQRRTHHSSKKTPPTRTTTSIPRLVTPRGWGSTSETPTTEMTRESFAFTHSEQGGVPGASS